MSNWLWLEKWGWCQRRIKDEWRSFKSDGWNWRRDDIYRWMGELSSCPAPRWRKKNLMLSLNTLGDGPSLPWVESGIWLNCWHLKTNERSKWLFHPESTSRWAAPDTFRVLLPSDENTPLCVIILERVLVLLPAHSPDGNSFAQPKLAPRLRLLSTWNWNLRCRSTKTDWL